MARDPVSDPQMVEESADARRAMLQAWRTGSLPGAEQAAIPDPAARSYRLRWTVRPRWFFVASLGILAANLDAVRDLPYHLRPSSSPVELGTPGEYRWSLAADGGFVRIAGIAGPHRGILSGGGVSGEVLHLVGTPLLIQRPVSSRPEPGTAELYSGEGRLWRVGSLPAGWWERQWSPGARYTAVRLEFAARGELPVDGDTWLLVEGARPERSWKTLGAGLASVGVSVVLLGAGLVRAWRMRRRRRPVLDVMMGE